MRDLASQWIHTIRLLLITLLVLGSGPVYAEWVAVEETPGLRTVYVDPDTISQRRECGDAVAINGL